MRAGVAAGAELFLNERFAAEGSVRTRRVEVEGWDNIQLLDQPMLLVGIRCLPGRSCRRRGGIRNIGHLGGIREGLLKKVGSGLSLLFVVGGRAGVGWIKGSRTRGGL